MSLLWEARAVKQLKTIYKRPSPKRNNHILSFAQSLISVQDKLFPNSFICSDSIEGISLFISKGNRLNKERLTIDLDARRNARMAINMNASMTVEAAIVLPLFLFFFLNLCTSIEMMRLHGNLQLSLWEVGNRMSVYGSVLNEGQVPEVSGETDSWWNELAGVVWSNTYVKAQIVEYLGEDYLEKSPLTYGTDGLQFLESNVFESEDCFEVVVTYSISPLCNISGFFPFRMANRYYGHLWNGYEIPGVEELVYVAENGVVYHTNKECTHLQLSVRQVSWQEAFSSRNKQGQKYTACEKCCKESVIGRVYITDEGDCYHCVKDCPGLKRTVIYMTISEAEQMKLCQRCAQQRD